MKYTKLECNVNLRLFTLNASSSF